MSAQRAWLENDYYGVLGVDKTASAAEVTKAYRKLARKLHPDANPNDPTAEDRFKEVSAAYNVLGDETRRSEYDELRRLGPMGGGFGPGAGGFGSPGGVPFDIGNLGDLFGGLFGQGAPGGARRGPDLETNLTMSFMDAVRGVTASVSLVSDATCSTCSGTGAQPGTSPRACGSCGGRGTQLDDQGFFSFSRPCNHCGGRGQRIDDPCRNCSGSGVERRPRTVKVRIPSGVEEGQRVRVKGRGGSGRGGPNGDLFVIVAVNPHPVFGRCGRDLTLIMPVSFSEATLGADVDIPMLEGGFVTLKLPAGTPSGRTFRVRDHGVATRRGQGDLLVTVEVEVPTDLTDRQREAIVALAEVAEGSPRDRLTEWRAGEGK
jgi:molecular chaperone DnaJ